MVSFPPLIPSYQWMAHFLQAIIKKSTIEKAFSEAGGFLQSPRDFGRYNLLDAKGVTITLSVAVEGGGRQLRYPDKLENLNLSEHGDWRRNHLKAIESCLGKKPYFSYLFPSLSAIYLNKEFKTLREFNTAIFLNLYSFIVADIDNARLQSFYERPVLMERGIEIMEKMKPEISSLEMISMYGKESLLGFLAYRI